MNKYLKRFLIYFLCSPLVLFGAVYLTAGEVITPEQSLLILAVYGYLGISLFFKSPQKAFLAPLPYLIFFSLLIFIIGVIDFGVDYNIEVPYKNGTYKMQDSFVVRFGSNIGHMMSNGTILIVILLIFLGPYGIFKYTKKVESENMNQSDD